MNEEAKWFPYNSGGVSKWYGNKNLLVENNGEIKNLKPSVVRNESYYLKQFLGQK